MLAKKYKGSIVSFRNDRMGARFLSLLNTIRIAGDYDIPYFFTWMTHGRASEELQAPAEIFDQAYFDAHFVSKDDFRHIDNVAIDLATLPAAAETTFMQEAVIRGDVFMCMGTDLVVLPGETAEDVAPRYAAAINKLVFSSAVQDAMKLVDATLAQSGTAFHVRRGDIIYDPVTSNQLWSNKYIPREFYEVLARRLITDPDHTILVFSDEPAEIARLKDISPQIMSPDEVLPEGLTLAQRDFMEIYAMSRCQQIIGPPGSGFSMAAALIGHRPIHDITTVLDPDGQTEALDLLVQRLKDRSPLFLSSGDTGQCLPFACEHLNGTGRETQALALLDGYRKDGFNKLFFYKMLLQQRLRCRKYHDYQEVLDSFLNGEADRALPARIEQHLSELSRVAAILATNANDTAQTSHQAVMSLWYGGGNRVAYNTLATLLSLHKIDPASFALPFDPELCRPLPPSLGLRPGNEGLLGDPKQLQFAVPPDLLVRDWQGFMGKTLNRGFDTSAAALRALELLNAQFGRHAPAASMASARGVYATVTGDHEDAMTWHKQALQEHSAHPLFLKRMATTMLAIDPQDPVARVLLERAASLAPKQTLYQAELAECLWLQQAPQDGLALMKVVAASPNVLPEIPYLAARMKRKLKQSDDEALALIDQALTSAPHVRRFMVFRVHLLIDLGRAANAIQAVDDIIVRYGVGGDIKALRNKYME